MKLKVLFFDSWKGGINNFVRLNEAFDKIGLDRLLIHLGSWGNEEVTIKEEIIGKLLVRDISYYSNTNLKKLLELEKPDLVLFLSTHTFAHRAMIRYCNSLDIPTINLYHGFVRVQAVDSIKNPYKVNKFAYFKFALKRLPKMITKTLPCYIKSLIETKSNLEEWRFFFRNLIEIITKPSNLRVAKDSKTTRCLVYASADKQHAMKTYGFVEEHVIDVGNPDLISFGMKIEHFSVGLMKKTILNKNVIYIDTALTATGLIFANQKEYIQHLIDTKEELSLQGLNLRLKPHPETKRLYDLNVFKNVGIEIIENENFIEELLSSCAVIVEPSTLALIPALMGIPMVLPTFGKLEPLLFGEVLLTYPRSIMLDNLSNFSTELKKESENLDLSKCEKWVNINSGPLPAEEMPNRVTNQILKLIKSR
jgi:hypothetical protein